MGFAGATKEFDQGAHFSGFEMVQLPAMTFDDVGSEFVEQGQARGGDADEHNPAVIRRPLAIDQTAFDKFIEQAGDIRGSGNQPGCQVEGLHALGVSRAKQTHRVILLGGDAVLLEKLVFKQAQAVVSTPEIEKDFLLGGVKSRVLNRGPFGRGNHIGMLVVGKIVV